MFNISTSTLGQLSLVDLQPYSLDRLPSLPSLRLEQTNLSAVGEFLWQLVSFSTLWKLLLLAFVVANFKNFPFVYHLRLLNAFRFVLRSQRMPAGPTPDQLFQPIITSSRASLMETDLYMHKSNSTYFSDVDIARTHLICTLFSKGIEKVRGGTTGIVNGKVSTFAVALGAVSCSFRRELKPYESYDMWTRVLAWDEKWLYVVTHFVKKGAHIEPREFTLYPKQNSANNSPASTPRGSVVSLSSLPRGSIGGEPSAESRTAICASALSKLVFKKGRITIAPAVMLEASGLLPPRSDETISAQKEHLAEIQIKANIQDVGPKKAMQTLDTIDSSDDEASSGKRGSIDSDSDATLQQWKWELIEAERKRGLKVAALLGAQNALEHELNDSEALGKHSDGTGIGGVVATLAQLGHLSNYQLL